MPHNVKSDAIDHLIDVIKGSDIMLSGTTVADRIVEMADMLAAGTLSLNGCVTVDSAISGSSTNPVQNKKIKAALDGKLDKTAIATATYYAADTATQTALAALEVSSTVVVPTDTDELGSATDPRVRLAWTSGDVIEVAPLAWTYDTSTEKYAYHAHGSASTASGVAGTDETWTVTTL